jgi:hypothetical protein
VTATDDTAAAPTTDPIPEPAWLADCSPEMRAGWARGRQIAAEHPMPDDLAYRLGELIRGARQTTSAAEKGATQS